MKSAFLFFLGLSLVACGKGASVSAFKMEEVQLTSNIESVATIDTLKEFDPLKREFQAPTKTLASKKWKRSGSCQITYNFGEANELSLDSDRSDVCRFDSLAILKKSVGFYQVMIGFYSVDVSQSLNTTQYISEADGFLISDIGEVGKYADDQFYYFLESSSLLHPIHLYIDGTSSPKLTLYQVDSIYNSNGEKIESITKITMNLK